ncbi:MAG: ribonucleoside triphosphate reductase, partial [Pseudomonadaceae bacterium]|nr:ribonucleoside triphosphate reductase [Pseudomonadaceae bacterium]
MPSLPPSFSPVSLRKRDGRLVAFELGKIQAAIAAAGIATGEFAGTQAGPLAELVLQRLLSHETLDIEQIQDQVEKVLMEAYYYASARAYIVYREQHSRLRRDR